MPFIICQTVELSREDNTDYYVGRLEQGDSGAHEWQVRVLKNSISADLTGCSAVCYGVREDGKTVGMEADIEGNTVRAVFDAPFYSVTGALIAQMVLSGADGATMTLATLVLGVRRTRTGELVTADERMIDLGGMMAILETTKAAARAATAAAAEARSAARSANFVVLGQYETLALLREAHPVGSAGDAWAVGEAEPYDVCVWDVDKEDWQNVGQLQGAKGETGVGIARIERTAGDGSSGSVDTYTITYTDNTTSTYQVRNGKDAETNPYELTVGPGCRYATINAAIEHARTICSATERVLIRVMPGVYEEQITLNPNPGIDIEGSGMDITIIRHPSIYPNAPLYTCGQGSFTALTLQSSCQDGTENPSYGVHVEYQSAPDAGGVVRFERCRLQSRLSAAIGAGLGANGGVQLTDCICVSETANAVYVHGYPESNVSGQTFTAHRCDFRALSGRKSMHVDDVNGIYGLTGSALTVECVGCRGGKMTLRTAAETFQGFVPNVGDVRLSAYSGDNEFVGANYGDLYNEVYVVCMRAANGMLFVPWQNASAFSIMISSVMDSSGSDVTGTVSLHSAHRAGFLLTTTSTEAGPYWVQAVIYPGS